MPGYHYPVRASLLITWFSLTKRKHLNDQLRNTVWWRGQCPTVSQWCRPTKPGLTRRLRQTSCSGLQTGDSQITQSLTVTGTEWISASRLSDFPADSLHLMLIVFRKTPDSVNCHVPINSLKLYKLCPCQDGWPTSELWPDEPN